MEVFRRCHDLRWHSGSIEGSVRELDLVHIDLLAGRVAAAGTAAGTVPGPEGCNHGSRADPKVC